MSLKQQVSRISQNPISRLSNESIQWLEYNSCVNDEIESEKPDAPNVVIRLYFWAANLAPKDGFDTLIRKSTAIQGINSNSLMIIRNGLSFFIQDDTLLHQTKLPNMILRYMFFMPLNNNFTMFLTSDLRYRLSIVQMIDNNIKIIHHLQIKNAGGGEIYLEDQNYSEWQLSEERRYLVMVYQRYFSNYFILIDLPDELAIEICLPLKGLIINVYWAPRDRYVCFVARDTGEMAIYETAMGDFQKISLDVSKYGTILDVTFTESGKRMNIVTSNFNLLVYRSSQILRNRSSQTLINKIFYPQNLMNISRVQFYLESEQQIQLQQGEFTKLKLKSLIVDDQLKKLAFMIDNRVFSVSITRSQQLLGKQIQVRTERNKEYDDLAIYLQNDPLKEDMEIKIARVQYVGQNNINVMIQKIFV